MKLATALAVAFALPATFATAEGAMNLGDSAPRPFGDVTVGAAGTIATKPRNISGNTPAPIMNDPSGTTLTPSVVSRGD